MSFSHTALATASTPNDFLLTHLESNQDASPSATIGHSESPICPRRSLLSFSRSYCASGIQKSRVNIPLVFAPPPLVVALTSAQLD